MEHHKLSLGVNLDMHNAHVCYLQLTIPQLWNIENAAASFLSIPLTIVFVFPKDGDRQLVQGI